MERQGVQIRLTPFCIEFSRKIVYNYKSVKSNQAVKLIRFGRNEYE